MEWFRDWCYVVRGKLLRVGIFGDNSVLDVDWVWIFVNGFNCCVRIIGVGLVFCYVFLWFIGLDNGVMCVFCWLVSI